LVLVFMVVSSFPSKVRSLDNAQNAPEPAQLDLTCPAARSYGFLKPLAFRFHRRHWGSLLVRGSSIFIERANAPPNYLVAAVCTSLRFRLHHAAMTSRKVLSCRTSPAAGTYLRIDNSSARCSGEVWQWICGSKYSRFSTRHCSTRQRSARSSSSRSVVRTRNSAEKLNLS